ncbi:MAG: mechanosensitive ion channel family protein [Candidatus Micrarchaeia archaeon]|jgi:small-conductance mechanosensitive channel
MDRKNKKNHLLLEFSIAVIIGLIVASIIYSIVDSLNMSSYLKSLALAITTLAVGIIISTIIARLIKEYIILNGVKQEASTISTLFEIIAYTTVAIIALYLVHINVTGLLISAGFLGIILGLAAQSTMGNIFSGISMIIAKPFGPGDSITIQTWHFNKLPSTYPHEEYIPGYEGTVVKIGLLYTELLDENNEPIYIPNGALNQALVINHRRASEKLVRVRAELNKSVSFDSIKKKITKLLKSFKVADRANINVEHVGENTYILLVSFYVKGNRKFERNIKSAVLKEILKHSK